MKQIRLYALILSLLSCCSYLSATTAIEYKALVEEITKQSIFSKEEVFDLYDQATASFAKEMTQNNYFSSMRKAGYMLKHIGELERAKDHFLALIKEAKEKEDAAWQLRLRVDCADIFRLLKNYDESLNILLPLTKEKHEESNFALMTTVHSTLGNLYKNKREYELSVQHYLKSISISQKINDKEDVARGYKNVSLAYRGLGEYERSLSFTQLSLEKYREIENQKGIAYNLQSMAFLLRKLGRLNEALEYSFDSLELYEKLGDKQRYAEVLGYISGSYRKLGYYDKALDYALKAYDVIKDTGETNVTVLAIINVGLIYQHLSEYDEALDHFNKALALSNDSNLTKYEASSHRNIGSIYNSIGKYQKSLRHVHLSLRAYEGIEDFRGVANCLSLLGDIYTNTKNYEKAFYYFDLAIKASRDLKDRWAESSILINLGSLQLSISENKGLDLILKGIELAEDIDTINLLPEAYKTLFIYYSSKDNLIEAQKAAAKYLELQSELDDLNMQSKIADIRTLHEIDKKQQEINKLKAETKIHKLEAESKSKEVQLLNKESRIQELTIAKERIYKTSSIITIIGVLIILMITIGRYRNSNKLKDLLELKNAEIEKTNEELGEMNTSKDQFFSVLAHDLKNSIGNMVNVVSILNDRGMNYPPEKRGEIISVIHRTSLRTYHLLDNLLKWGTIQMNAVKFNYVEILLYTICEQVNEDLRVDLKSKSIELDIDVEEDLLVYTDADVVRVVLRNLVGNAIKFSEKGASIFIQTYSYEGKLLVYVKDHGRGIPKELQNVIFTGGKLHDKSISTEVERGSGIGLKITHSLIEKLGEQIDFNSELGKGSEFYFSLKAVNTPNKKEINFDEENESPLS